MKEALLILGAVTIITVALVAFIQRDNTTTNSDSSYGKICLDGVMYWRGYQTLAVKYTRDGTVELCK